MRKNPLAKKKFKTTEFQAWTREKFPHFVPIYNCKSRFLVCWGGAGSSKSHRIARKLLFRIINERNTKHRVLVIRKVAATLNDSVFQLMLNLISAWGLEKEFSVIRSAGNQRLTYKRHKKSCIIFKGMDDPEKIKSIEGITMIWCEEATELTEQDFTQINIRLRGERADLNYKQIMVSFNPVSAQSWCKKLFFDDETKLPNVYTHHSTYLDNPYIGEEYKEVMESLKRTNPHYYNIYALGKWGVAEGLIFSYESRPIRYEELQGGSWHYGLDFGFTNHPTACYQVYLDKKNAVLYVYDGFQKRGMTNADIANELVKRKWHKEKIVADSAEPKSIDQLKRGEGNTAIRRIRPAKKGPDSIRAGITYMKLFKIVIASHLSELKEEMDNYCWATDKNGKPHHPERPIDDFNHGQDAIRYAIEDQYENRSIKSFLR